MWLVDSMYVESLNINNYRNYDELFIMFDKNTNILYGDNAQGKTNILESIYMAIADIKRIQPLLDEGKYDVGRQPLLVYLDIYLMFAKKYPNMASETVGKLKRKSLKETFDSWWERNEHKIPKKYRIGIRQSADDLFDELFAIQSWEKE